MNKINSIHQFDWRICSKILSDLISKQINKINFDLKDEFEHWMKMMFDHLEDKKRNKDWWSNEVTFWIIRSDK